MALVPGWRFTGCSRLALGASALASQWEARLTPLSSPSAAGRAADLNAFFESQSAALQRKLRRESLAQTATSEPVRSSGDTARIAIGKMY